jgi:RNA polymerase sigma-70 factor (ECF subfamily)
MERLVIDTRKVVSQSGALAGFLMNGSEQLTARARCGDEEAFRLIFDRYARPIISFLYDMVGQRELAEELTQETFVRAYKSLNRLRDDSKLSTWLFGIAKNVARECIRSRGREERKVVIEEHSTLELLDQQPAPEGLLLNKELNGIIHSALNSLPEDKRTVFVLKVLHQKSYEEISDITGSSIAKLKTDLHRARAEMRERIRPYLELGDAM